MSLHRDGPRVPLHGLRGVGRRKPAVIVTPTVTPAPTSPARIAAAVSDRQPLRHGCPARTPPRPAGPRRRGERRRRWRRRWRQPGRGGRQRSAHLSHVQAERTGHRFRQPARREVGRLGEQLGGRGSLAGVLGQAPLDQRTDLGGEFSRFGGLCTTR